MEFAVAHSTARAGRHGPMVAAVVKLRSGTLTCACGRKATVLRSNGTDDQGRSQPLALCAQCALSGGSTT
jgi:hypothetical protein